MSEALDCYGVLPSSVPGEDARAETPAIASKEWWRIQGYHGIPGYKSEDRWGIFHLTLKRCSPWFLHLSLGPDHAAKPMPRRRYWVKRRSPAVGVNVITFLPWILTCSDWWIFGPGMWRHVCIRHLAHARKKSIGTGLFGPCPRCPRPKEMSCRVCNVAFFLALRSVLANLIPIRSIWICVLLRI